MIAPGKAILTLSMLWLAGQEPAPKPAVPTPREQFGFDIGEDYCLANYKQLAAYWDRLERASDRMRILDIGATEEGRRQLAAVVTSPANMRRIDHYREIARRLSFAEGLDAAAARKLAADGKAVVWIDGGLHANETLCAQALIETVYRILTGQDEETLRILDEVVILFVHANPDGHDLVADWYMKEEDPKKRTLQGLPRLYQKYIGHDNNRDFYANTQAETKNLNRLMYRDWLPQIVYNHHQAGPPGTVLFFPPFRDPFNYFCDPLAISGIDAVGASMAQRFLAEGKPGATSRSGAPYSTWFNGGLRTTAGFHNMIGILTETIGTPTPMRIPLVTAKLLPKGDYLDPIAPQEWHFRQSVEYSVTASKAVLDYASRHREQLLFNAWLMGHNAIDKGNRDSWTITPKVVQAAGGGQQILVGLGQAQGIGRDGPGGNRVRSEADFARLFRDPSKRDPRAYVIPADQVDFPTAAKFVNALLGTGVRVHRATDDFEALGRRYPRGSFVVKTAQSFRAHVLDMFEPQDHPNDFAYPGGPPVRPYDSAGYTLAFQMGIRFDRFLDGFQAPLEEIRDEAIAPPSAKVSGQDGAVGFWLSPRLNDAFLAVNRLLKSGEEVRRLQKAVEIDGVSYDAGTFYIPRKPATLPKLEALATELGTPFRGGKSAPGAEAVGLKPARVALWDRPGGSMPSGWTRWLLERFEFPFRVVQAAELDKENLRDEFDAIILVDGAYMNAAGPGNRERPEGGGDAPAANERPADAPPPGEGTQGPGGQGPGARAALSARNGLANLKAFLEAGGTILAIGGSTRIGQDLELPLKNQLVDVDAEGKERPIPPEKYYIPSSVLSIRVEPSDPLAWGMDDRADVMFSTSPTFRPLNGDGSENLRQVGWFDSKAPLRSGWAWGQERLENGVAIVDARVGKGRLALFGPQVLFRGQPHGTFKFVFNGIVQSVAGD
ncbi:MAG: M14 metallopeptidase family protein [Isosphaeraceae bacterium]